MKRALVLSGGGARGAFQVGMLQELVVEQGLDFEIIRGVSVGALNAAFLAQAPMAGDSQGELAARVRELHKLWTREIQGNESVYSARSGFPGVIAGADSLYSLEPLKRLIDRHLSVAKLKGSGRDFAVGTVSLVNGLYQEWRPAEPDFLDAFLASASIPVVFPYVDLKGRKDVLVDGGVRNITPLSSALRQGPDEVYILLASRVLRAEGEKIPESSVEVHRYAQWDDNLLGTKVNGLDVLERTIDILTDEVYLDDIRGALSWNTITEAVDRVVEAGNGDGVPGPLAGAIAALAQAREETRKRPVKLFVLAPRVWFQPEAGTPGKRNPATEFSPQLIRKAIRHGREVAADPAKWLWPPVGGGPVA